MASSDDVAKNGASASTKADGPRGTPARKSERPSMRPGGPSSLIGTVLSGRYRIERVIGEGGMGAVYQAEHTHMRKRFAVKVLHPEMSRLPEVVARFEREAMAAAHIDHPNVAMASDFGKLEDGSFFLVLEYVEGKSLRESIGKGRLSVERALHVTRQIAAALARAHQLNIVHRDLKPENVMLVERDGDPDFVKVLDFGIAKVPVGELGTGGAAPGQPVLTQLGMVYGTPEYMAPEQALGQSVDARADLYALGIMAYEMLTGHRPFDHESKVALLGMQVTAPPPPMAVKAPDANIPPEVEAIVVKCLAKESSHRWNDAKELMEAILGVAVQLVSQGRMAPLPSFATGPMSMPGSAPSMPGPLGGPSSIPGPKPSYVDAPRTSYGVAPPPPPPTPSQPEMARGPASALPSSAPATSARPALLQSNVPVIDPMAFARRSSKKLLVAGAALGIVVLVAIVAFLIVDASKHADGAAVASASGSAGEGQADAVDAGRVTPVAPEVDAQIRAATSDVDKGNFGSAIDVLKPIEEKYPERADIHALLERAYTGAKAPKDAMREAALWLTADPDKAYLDAKLEEDVRNTALFGKEGADEAFRLLESEMKTIGVDILYDIAYGASGHNFPLAVQRATRALQKPDVRGRASAACGVAIDLRLPAYRPCDQVHAIVLRAKDDGDGRALERLQSMTQTASCGGGGFLGGRRSDCWPCLRKDSALKDAIAAIEARVRK